MTIGQREDLPGDCVYAVPGETRELLYRNARCTVGRATPDEGVPQKPLEFEPRCLVVLIEDDSRAALFAALFEAGRRLSDPLRLNVTYTTLLAPDPDYEVASMNCELGDILRENAARDAVGQELEREIYELEQELEKQNKLIAWFDDTVRGLSAYMPPSSPPPPWPDTSPSPPVQESFAERLATYRSEAKDLERALDAKLAERGGHCTPSPTQTCGRTHIAGPDPYIGADGVTRCAGHATGEALEGLFCAHWSSPVRAHPPPSSLPLLVAVAAAHSAHPARPQNNVDAAETASEAEELLSEAPPWCWGETGDWVPCSPVADRVVRAGAYELEVRK